MHYQSQTWIVKRLNIRHQVVLVKFLGFRNCVIIQYIH